MQTKISNIKRENVDSVLKFVSTLEANSVGSPLFVFAT